MPCVDAFQEAQARAAGAGWEAPGPSKNRFVLPMGTAPGVRYKVIIASDGSITVEGGTEVEANVRVPVN